MDFSKKEILMLRVLVGDKLLLAMKRKSEEGFGDLSGIKQLEINCEIDDLGKLLERLNSYGNGND